jgi:NADPH:quinone reductase-like Zn-dependent oxidoreductase
MPATPGGDLAGVVEAVGPGVTDFKVGQGVYALIGLYGAYAEHVAVKTAMAAPKPSKMDYVEAASVPLAALTAWQALFDTAGLKAGQRVLVHAAAGGVGSFAVQLAHSVGAHVVGTASAANGEFVRSLGANEFIDYRAGDFAPYAGTFDVVFDLIGGETSLRSLELLKKGGVHVGGVPAPALTEKAGPAGIRVLPVQVKPNGAELRQIAALIDAGKVRTTIAAVLPLAEAGQAHELSKTGHTRGKIVLRAVG